MEKKQNKPKKAGKIILIIGMIAIPVILAVMVLIGAATVIPLVALQLGWASNEKAADRVVTMIEGIDDENITVDYEDELKNIKAEYDKLTDKQKKMVKNYEDLEEAFEKLAVEKIEAEPREIVAEINKLKVNELTAETTVVDQLLNRYNGLTKEQQKLVTNINLLNEYKQIVNEKIQIKEKGQDLVENFNGFSGKWGDFGAHISEHQGMLEAVIKSDRENFLFQDYFTGAPNDLDMYVSPFDVRDNETMGSCLVRFTGPSCTHSGTTVVYGEVTVNNDGTLKLVIDSVF